MLCHTVQAWYTMSLALVCDPLQFFDDFVFVYCVFKVVGITRAKGIRDIGRANGCLS